jgi:hypothetical protein
LIPSSEIAYLLRVEAERRRRSEDALRRRGERALRRRELWHRVRAGLGAVRRLRAA